MTDDLSGKTRSLVLHQKLCDRDGGAWGLDSMYFLKDKCILRNEI